ncbi:tRNA (adenosine(37)-N6)-threonylcarbamoyltransferase complex dimerization subunit type 1 TsaB [Granulicella tundricola]|uniref:Peptidase M22 glycoprotease n=1 Tax=Granulicella tundricola (strain ATCC BAA-1859 / DSM 23138 / MP5ACTX9) TaxID=1198114 RepID=E8X4A8_GRATM|nr:tRNA (adenosine(37)-N6)-threonylcarbamoyltransferase complex dimerization subunit type 1 TsaB [Granulicella tundricola]ADW68235.1 peptidase M22 glycoprotease [Granulicella tundricola MP5ACTX9]
MAYLLMNTCGLEGVVALAADGVMRVEVLPGRGTSEHLMPAVRRVLEGFKVGELAGVGVVVGPGSFTGVRVGLSAAKGLCEAGAVGMVAMSRLALVAAALGEAEGDVVALLDGGRGEFYCGVYRGGERVWERLILREEADRLVAEGVAVTCEARVAEVLGERVRLVREAGAEEMLAMVVARGKAGDWSDVAAVDANYLRRTDAEILVHGR